MRRIYRTVGVVVVVAFAVLACENAGEDRVLGIAATGVVTGVV